MTGQEGEKSKTARPKQIPNKNKSKKNNVILRSPETLRPIS